MSKVEELRAKYPRITTAVFNKFVDGDKTKTKKYLPFMLKTWVDRTSEVTNSAHLVQLVNMFDELLPYIKNKDIYHKDYESITHFLSVLDNAMVDKEDNTFVREEHINILYESDEFILLQPKTHRGSCKYGANTKWCTASKTDEGTFNRYFKNGFLVYVISKKDTIGSEYKKIAFYSKKNEDPILDSIETYNSLDDRINMVNIVNGGWEVHKIFELISIYRANFSNWKRTQMAKESIKSTLTLLSSIDFNVLTQSIKIVENNENIDYINDVKNRINDFIKQIPIKL